VPVVGILSLHIRLSHKSEKKGSSISKLDGLSPSGYNFSVVLRDYVEVEDAPASRRNLSYSSDAFELPAATYEKLRRLAAEYLRRERAGHTL